MINAVVKREEGKKKKKKKKGFVVVSPSPPSYLHLGITDTQVCFNKYIRISISGVRENQYNTSALLDSVLGKRCAVLLKPLITLSLIELRC